MVAAVVPSAESAVSSASAPSSAAASFVSALLSEEDQHPASIPTDYYQFSTLVSIGIFRQYCQEDVKKLLTFHKNDGILLPSILYFMVK